MRPEKPPPPETSAIPPPVARERRASEEDRRERSRQGKYDRRRNRCRACQSFVKDPNSTVGTCQRHHRPYSPDAFACLWFEPLA